MKVPIIKNGPKGIWLCIFFLPKITSGRPTKVPSQKEEKTATKTLGQPKNKAIKSANFTSPIPIHLPFDITIRNKKNNGINKERMISCQELKFSIFKFQFPNKFKMPNPKTSAISG